ncbi:hypothetical protein WHR41_07644 [Cladosporium halotolerans]|uniref:Partial AB-hydrolase lipase domain-containing protein n=1 Tax=Cladosporium halotolerans TaxID=1052096 RepID=A0AB34KIB4_9PEZI
MPHSEMTTPNGCDDELKAKYEREYAAQSERLAHLRPSQEDATTGNTQATGAKFVTPHDPIVQTEQGPLPVVPIDEALKLNRLKDRLEDREPQGLPCSNIRQERGGAIHGTMPPDREAIEASKDPGAPLGEAVPASSTNPLFPPLPMYGPPSPLRTLQCWFFRFSSAILSFCFLLTIVAGAAVTSVPKIWRRIRYLVVLKNPDRERPFYEEEKKRAKARKAAAAAWVKQKQGKGVQTPGLESALEKETEWVPTEGGPDPIVCDIRYYARRVGLDAEVFDVQTEDGFVIDLWHVYDPREYRPVSPEHHKMGSPDLFRTKSSDSSFAEAQASYPSNQKKYPVLMIHGLLQSAGAYCCNDDDSLAFFLAKSGYDVWLGNNRCGFKPRHTSLKYEDPRMWAWNIRQMGVMDLPALISRVLGETGFSKLGLIAHSQGTTQTLVALAKEQRPDIGDKISVFCALAPAVYAGPLIGKIYFKIMRVISPSLFRLIFGIHSFIPLMMHAHATMHAGWYGWMGYMVFSFLFNWSDSRWDRGLRDRMFQFAPVFVSSESMRWWLGRECFAKQKCILATREEGKLEDREDEEDDEVIARHYVDREPHVSPRRKLQRNLSSFHCQTLTHQHHDASRAKYSWYDSHFPPLALWVCGADDLVDGRRLLRRFDRGREPSVRIVHKKIVEGYEHLDVIWAMDMIEKVGKEIREVIWRTVGEEDRARCRVPVECEEEIEVHPDDAAGQERARRASLASAGGPGRGGRRPRMESISESPDKRPVEVDGEKPRVETEIDATRGDWAEENKELQSDRQKKNAEMMDGFEEERVENAAAGEEEGVEAKDMVSGQTVPKKRERKWSEAKFTDIEEKANPLE